MPMTLGISVPPKHAQRCTDAIGRGEQLVYFIQGWDGGPIKIGVANDPVRRLRSLQVGSPVRLVIRWLEPGGTKREAYLHSQFQHDRLWGEWFEPTPELVKRARASDEASPERARMKREAREEIRADLAALQQRCWKLEAENRRLDNENQELLGSVLELELENGPDVVQSAFAVDS